MRIQSPFTKHLLLSLLLIAAVFAVYAPALNGEKLWDDDAHVTAPDMRTLDGLQRIWFELGATQQYYPVLHSAFWLESRAWGDAVLGYHLVTVGLHLSAALLFFAILRRLRIPGAWLAAFIFALHPVQVESVAWITEQKNTLSLVFYLGAALSYLRFDETHQTRFYWLASLAFILALLTKSVTATLPAALWVLLWWQRGRLRWREEIAPLLPWLVLAIISGATTAWVERVLLAAQGPEYDLSLLQRLLLAGRVPWFYLGKLLWPADLAFIYPRWSIDASAVGAYAYPAATVLLLTVCWHLRSRTRAPLAAVLLFGGSLVPVLGFLNVYPFIYSYVADHFQYLACLSLIASAAAIGARATARYPRGGRVVVVVFLASLTWISWRQSAYYQTRIGLYKSVLAINPDCWMAHNNLGLEFKEIGATVRAEQHFRTAIRLHPNWAGTHCNLGELLAGSGRVAEAVACFRRAIALDPNYVPPRHNLASTLREAGQARAALREAVHAVCIRSDVAETWVGLAAVREVIGDPKTAIRYYLEALAIDHESADAQINLTHAYLSAGRVADAIRQGEQTIIRLPNAAVAFNNLGNAYVAAQRYADAIPAHARAVQLNADYFEAHHNLALALRLTGRPQLAVEPARRALQLRNNVPEVHVNLALALHEIGQNAEAKAHWAQAKRLRPDLPRIPQLEDLR